MGKTAQWIIDARKAKKARKIKEKQADAIKLSDNPLKRRRELRAIRRSATNKPTKRKHGRQ